MDTSHIIVAFVMKLRPTKLQRTFSKSINASTVITDMVGGLEGQQKTLVFEVQVHVKAILFQKHQCKIDIVTGCFLPFTD